MAIKSGPAKAVPAVPAAPPLLNVLNNARTGVLCHLTGTLHLSAVWILSLHDASQVQEWHVVCFWRWDLENIVDQGFLMGAVLPPQWAMEDFGRGVGGGDAHKVKGGRRGEVVIRQGW